MSLSSVQARPYAAEAGGVGLTAEAFAQVYAEHMPALTRYCRGILRDAGDAEDAAQNAMERALAALSGGPPPQRMRPWLLTIARREAITLLRRRRAVPAELDESLLGGCASAEELAAVRQRLAELLADVKALAPRQREALVQRELGGRSYREIAGRLGVTEGAAQQVVLEARQSLAQFAEGRSLDCGEVQSWLSANDRARVRTRRVRAHLRGCACCESFQAAIASRRRGFALLLPGAAGGGALGPWLGALLGQGAAKVAGAGALVVAGATLFTALPAVPESAAPPAPPAPPAAERRDGPAAAPAARQVPRAPARPAPGRAPVRRLAQPGPPGPRRHGGETAAPATPATSVAAAEGREPPTAERVDTAPAAAPPRPARPARPEPAGGSPAAAPPPPPASTVGALPEVPAAERLEGVVGDAERVVEGAERVVGQAVAPVDDAVDRVTDRLVAP